MIAQGVDYTARPAYMLFIHGTVIYCCSTEMKIIVFIINHDTVGELYIRVFTKPYQTRFSYRKGLSNGYACVSDQSETVTHTHIHIHTLYIHIGVVQTAYANGSATDYLTNTVVRNIKLG